MATVTEMMRWGVRGLTPLALSPFASPLRRAEGGRGGRQRHLTPLPPFLEGNGGNGERRASPPCPPLPLRLPYGEPKAGEGGDGPTTARHLTPLAPSPFASPLRRAEGGRGGRQRHLTPLPPFPVGNGGTATATEVALRGGLPRRPGEASLAPTAGTGGRPSAMYDGGGRDGRPADGTETAAGHRPPPYNGAAEADRLESLSYDGTETARAGSYGRQGNGVAVWRPLPLTAGGRDARPTDGTETADRLESLSYDGDATARAGSLRYNGAAAARDVQARIERDWYFQGS
jgi:hypothetical protein